MNNGKNERRADMSNKIRNDRNECKREAKKGEKQRSKENKNKIITHIPNVKKKKIRKPTALIHLY